jgi:hypothetical protein
MADPAEARVPPADPWDIELTYTHNYPLWAEPKDLVERWHVSADVVDDGGKQLDHVGDIEIITIDYLDTRDPFGLLDGDDVDLGAVAGAIFDLSEGGLDADLDEQLEPYGSRILILNHTKLVQDWRGFGLGALLTGIALRKLSGGVRAAACYPAPLRDSEGDSDDDVRRDRAIKALSKVWAQLGFEHFRNGVHVLDLNLVTLNQAIRALRDQIDQYRQ